MRERQFGPRGGSRLRSSGGAQRGPMPFDAALEKACTSPTIWSSSSRRMLMATLVPYGQPADRLLLTNLYNLAQPLIRYDLVDAVTIFRRAVSMWVCSSPHHRGQRSDQRSLRVRKRCSGAPGGLRADCRCRPRRRQLLVGQRWCRRVRGDRRFMRPPASADGTDRRAPPARRAGVETSVCKRSVL